MAITAKFQADFSSFLGAVQKADVQLRSFETGAGRVEKSLSRMADSFSGRKIIQDATMAAAAVEKIGGASKLTESEQARLNAQLTEALAKYRALGVEAPKNLQDLANATKQVEQSTTLAQKATSVLSSAFGQFTAANLAASAIQNVIGKVSEFVAQGQKLPGLQASFDRLARGVGQNSQDMLNSMQGATRGLVADIDLMQAANKAMLLGLPVTAESMGELASAATVLGRAMGQDAAKSVDDLITALGRSSPLILDNLGLTVKVGEANEAYAQKLGKSVDAMTDAERKIAFYEAAMEKARQKTAELGQQSLTLSEQVDRAWVSMSNVVSRSVASMNVGIGAALSSAKNFAQFVSDAAQFGFAVATINAAAREEAAAIGLAGKAAGEAAKAHRDFAKELQRAIDTMPALTREGQRQYEAAKRLGATTQELTEAFGLSALQQKLLDEQTKLSTKSTQAQASAHTKATKEIVRGYSDTERALESYTKVIAKANEQVDDISGLSRRSKVEVDYLNTSIKKWLELQSIIQLTNVKIVEGIDNLRLPGALDLGKLTQIPQAAATIWEKIFGGSSGDFGAMISQTLVSALAGGGNAMKSVGAQLGGQLASGVTKAITGKAIGSTIGGIAGSVVPVLGNIAGAALGGWIGGLFKGNQVKDLIEDRFGSYDQLRTLLNTLEDVNAANEAWINLTQRTGKGDVASATRQIDSITAALARQKDKQLETTLATEMAAQAQQAAQEKALSVIKGQIGELSQEYERLFKAVSDEAPEEEMGVIERQMRERMAAIETERSGLEEQLKSMTEELQDAFAAVGEAARDAAQEIVDAFSGIRLPSFDASFGGASVPSFGDGGIVRKPTLAIVGEKGPEAIVPLNRAGSAIDQRPLLVQLVLPNKRVLAEELIPEIPGALRMAMGGL